VLKIFCCFLSISLKAQRNAPIKEVFLLNGGTEMKFYYNIQKSREKTGTEGEDFLL
jgi:hypothetical protein